MKKDAYIKCNLYCIPDDFCILYKESGKEAVINSKKQLLEQIIVHFDSKGMMRETLTGINFDYSVIKIYDYYSKVFRRKFIKQSIKRSSAPIHVSLYSEEVSDHCVSNVNFEYVDDSDVEDYKNNIIIKFGSIENYTYYLLNLKDMANRIYENAIYECRQRVLKKVKG